MSNKRLLLASAGLVFVALTQGIKAQAPSFEVAAIKASDPASGVLSGTSFSPNRLIVTGSLRTLLMLAYGVQAFQIVEGPKWLDSDRFDVDAKPENPASPDQLKLMLRALLADRFRLVLHTETRELPVYAMVLARNGPKVQEAKDGVRGMSGGRDHLKGLMQMPELAQYLSPTLGRTVLDKTGLAGDFDIKLEWTPDESVKAAGDFAGSSIFTAIQEQLGLRLEATKGPVEVLVVDRVEQPSAN
jgi:uncharacterized protein (TIGR03435 family)